MDPAEARTRTPSESERLVSRGVVGVYKEYLGRGPVSAHTTITEDFVATICSGSLTKAETSLCENEDEELVRSIRRKFQIAMSGDIKRLVEETTGRPTATFLSDHNVADDIAIEVVVFTDSKPISAS